MDKPPDQVAESQTSYSLMRLAIDLGVGVAIAAYFEPLPSGAEVFFAVVGGVLWFGERVQLVMPLRPRSRYAGLAILLVIFCGIIALGVKLESSEPVLVSLAAVLPTVPAVVFLLVSGIWACVMIQRSAYVHRYRRARYSVDVLVVALMALETHMLLDDRDMLTTGLAAGLLFPIGVWLIIRAWRTMASSRRAPVQAGADIALSLLLGVTLVLFLVWLANLTDLSEAEIFVLRTTLDQVGSVADLPWLLWVVLYMLLAALYVHFALFPRKLAGIRRWITRLHVAPSIDASRRVLSGVHIGLLVTVLIAVSAPASLEATLRGPLKAKYTVALQRELECREEQAAYEEIRRQFTAQTGAPISVQPSVSIISKVHEISKRPGEDDAIGTERDLAQRLGRLQATALRQTASQSVLSAHQGELARFDQPVRDVSDLNERLGRLDLQQRQADTAKKEMDQAAELATVAVANMVQIPGIDGKEVFQIVKEYLSGLVENSGIKELFAARLEHLAGDVTQLRADKMVVPDPEQLKLAASDTMTQQKVRLDPADAFATDILRLLAQTESAADAAVDLTNDVRSLEKVDELCGGCQRSGRPGEERSRGRGEHPAEPARGGR